MALPFAAENDSNSTVELDENEALEDRFDLLTDNEQLSDESFEDEEADENNKDKELLYPIALEMAFTDWKKLDEWFNKHGLEQGFAFTVTHSEKDKEDGLPRRRTYSCMKGRKYIPRKEAQINDERNTGHHTGDCKFYINTYRRKKDNLIHITKIEGNHNHELVENIDMVASRYRKLNPEMRDDVKLLATCGIRAGAIIEVLQKKHPNKYIHARNVYNMVQAVRNKNGTSDAGSMYLELMKQQQEDPTFYVDAHFEGQDNHLTRLCWMRPSQHQLWGRFHDVILLDTTAKTNRYSMILCVVILIDNHNRSRLAATALLSDETKDTFSWLFSSLAKTTGGLIPKLLFTDADPSMIAAASSTWPTTKHHFCLFHIRKNLEKHFLGKYGVEKWKKFFGEFCHMRNSRVESIFEEKWNALLQNYADAANYLQRQLYPCREAWVLCFTHRAFNAGAQSTQRVEGYNGIIKNNVNGSSSLLELEHTIERLLAKESRFIRYNEAIGKLPVSRDEDYHDHYFKKIDMSCQRFLTPAILKLQRHEMNRSMHYRCYNANLKDELEKKFTIEAPNGMFSEDMFDACVIELEQLIVGLDMEKITELWRISSIDKKSQHFIVLYGNAGHLCTCLTLINRGLVCRHFFALMLSSSNAKFHIALISQRWHTDALIMEGNSMQSSEPVISSAISNDEFGTFENVMETDFSYLENIRGCYVFTKEVREEMTQKQQWGKGFGMMKKVLNLAIATGRVEELYEIHEKLSKELESEMTQTVQGNDVIEFAHTISNPLSIRTKGRKPKNVNGAYKGKKRQIRSSQGNKENNTDDEDHEELSHKKPRNVLNTVNLELNEGTEGEGESSKSKSRRCGVCNQEGHNARTCSNKKKSTD